MGLKSFSKSIQYFTVMLPHSMPTFQNVISTLQWTARMHSLSIKHFYSVIVTIFSMFLCLYKSRIDCLVEPWVCNVRRLSWMNAGRRSVSFTWQTNRRLEYSRLLPYLGKTNQMLKCSFIPAWDLLREIKASIVPCN